MDIASDSSSDSVQCLEQHEKLSQFRSEGKFCDVKIRVGDETFNCHRVILATRSAYFEVLFGSNFDDSTSAEVTLHDHIRHAGAFQAILGFIYEGNIPEIDVDNVADLFDTAQFLGVEKIVAICGRYISLNIGNPSIDLFKILNLSTRCSVLLKKTISQHILSIFKHFVQRVEFSRVPYDELHFLFQEYRSSCVPFKDEEFLSRALLRWVNYASNERRQYIEGLAKILNCDVRSSEDGKFVRREDSKRSLDDEYDALTVIKRIKLDDEEPPPHPENENNAPTIHLFTEEEKGTSYMFQIISLRNDKIKPDWFLSRQYYGDKKPEYHKVQVFAAFNDYFYCFKHPRGVNQDAVFHLYSSLDFPREQPSQVLTATPLTSCDSISRSSQMCGFGTDTIYLYRGRYVIPSDAGRAHAEHFNEDELGRGIYCYNCCVNKWFPVPRMNNEISYSRLISNGNLVFLIGGKENTYSASAGYVHQAYDPRSPNWLTLPRSSYAYNFRPFGDALNERIYVHNGEQMEAFDPTAGRWEIIDSDQRFLENASSVMTLGQLVSFDNKLYLVYSDSGSRYFRFYDPLFDELSPVMSFYTDSYENPCSKYVPYNAVIFKPVGMH